MRRVARFFSTILVAALVTPPVVFAKSDVKDELKKLREAEQVLKQAIAAPEKGIQRDQMAKAECIGVFPGVKKAAFIVGGEWGSGVFTCRGKDGAFGAPAFFKTGGPSVGWQFGGEEADIIMLIMNDEGVQKLL